MGEDNHQHGDDGTEIQRGKMRHEPCLPQNRDMLNGTGEPA
jgi:hypothetical protein